MTPIAGNNGTIIVIENLFYNMPTRKVAVSSDANEFHLLIDLLVKYSIHFSQKCSFSLKKHGVNSPFVSTQFSSSIMTNIDRLYAQNISTHLMSIEIENDEIGFQVSGYFSNGDLNLKRMHFLMFINSRLVQCSMLQKNLKEVYRNHLKKGCYPFIFLTLQVDPKKLDVNVHPTKNEVFLLHQNEIVLDIKRYMLDKLRNVDSVSLNRSSSQLMNTTTTCFAQKLTRVGISSQAIPSQQSQSSKRQGNGSQRNSLAKPKINNIKPSNKVRSDCNEQRLDQYLNRSRNNGKPRRQIKLT